VLLDELRGEATIRTRRSTLLPVELIVRGTTQRVRTAERVSRAG
jgi:hypothetical protein